MEFQRQSVVKGYGKEILEMTMDLMKDRGFEYIRLYTDPVDNAAACELYRKYRMLEETCKGEILQEDVTLFSKNLHGKEVKPNGKEI